MHIIEQRILNKFKKEPLREIPTTELVREAYPEEHSRMLAKISDSHIDKRAAIQAMRKKGQLHRKVLYHINNLVKDGVLKVGSVKGKGEKHFTLAMDEGQLVVEKKHRQIVITKPSISTSLIEEYEIKSIVYKFDPEGWITKLNCILLESTNFDGINHFYDLVYSCFSEVNDALGLNNFEHLIQKSSEENIEDIIKRLDLDTKDQGRVVCIIINVKNIIDNEKMRAFIQSYSRMRPKNISIVFKTDTKELKSHEALFESIISDFSKEEIKLNIHNRNVHDAPIIIGKGGPYTLREDEWKDYEETVRGKTIGLAIAHTSLAIDCNRFFSQYQNTRDFRDLILKVSRMLLKVSASQRKKSNEYFKRLNELNKPYTKKFFGYAKNYIRFWNFDFEDERQKNLMALMESTKEEVKRFCATERTIYKSCGIPFNFDITFSGVFKKFSSGLSERKYRRISIRGLQDLSSPELNRIIRAKEKLADIFDGNDRMRLHRGGKSLPEEILKEMKFLMNTNHLPIITYDFSEIRGEIKLTSFMG